MIISLFRSRFPIDWKTPFGYLINFTAASLAILYGAYVIVPVLIFFIGSCCIFKLFATEIIDFLDDVDDQPIENDGKFEEKFCDFLQLFADIKQFSITTLAFN